MGRYILHGVCVCALVALPVGGCSDESSGTGGMGGTGATGGNPCLPEAGCRPNVLFILVDDLRPELSSYGRSHVVSPNIDAGRPLTMTIPACTYYREALLDGHYRLYIHLQMQDEFPPTPRAGDYWWASTKPIRFPLNGKTHEARIEPLDITLRPVK